MARKEQQAVAADDPVVERLDILIALLMPAASKYGGQLGALQSEILALCDYNHTTEEICKAVKKTNNHVNKELSLLRSKGMVKTVRRGERSVHIRV